MAQNKLILPYPPEDIKDFFTYDYEWIDEFNFLKRIEKILPNYIEYELEVRKKFLKRGWSGDGEINNIWIPPFLISKIAKGGEETFLKKFHDNSVVGKLTTSPKSWTKGLILWHVKQKEDGISFICSPLELDIPSYALS